MSVTPHDVELAAFNLLSDMNEFSRVYIGEIETYTQIPAASVFVSDVRSFERTDEKYGRYRLLLTVLIVTGGNAPEEEKRKKTWDTVHKVIVHFMKHPTLGSTIESGIALNTQVRSANVRRVEARGMSVMLATVVFEVTIDMIDIETV